MPAGRRLVFSSIWKRFVIRFSVLTLLFGSVTLLMVLDVSLPTSNEQTHRVIDRQGLELQQRLLAELASELRAHGPELSPGQEVIERRLGELGEQLGRLDELETLSRAKKTPESLSEIDARLHSLLQEIEPVFEEYPADDLIHSVHNRMILILFIIFICIAGMMYVFVKDVVDPLEGIIATSRKVAFGSLSETFPVREDQARRDELDDLASVLNDLLANFQEAFLLIGVLNNESAVALQEMQARLGQVAGETAHQALSEHTDACRSGVAEIAEILGSFDFYSTTHSADSGSADSVSADSGELPGGGA